MRWLRDYRLTVLILILMVALQALLYGHLPDPVPSHWNAAGLVDATLPKPWGAWILPIVFVPTSVFLCVLPAVSPANFPMTPFGRIYRLIVAVIAAFGLWTQLLTDGVALGFKIDLPAQLLCAVGVLYALLGHWMPQLTQNFFVGIRTPWTLADEDVWTRTHRLAGPLMIAAGLAIALTAALAPQQALSVLIGASLLAFGIPVIYSWRISPTPGGGTDPQ
jgi:uncharacterized membrane protein